MDKCVDLVRLVDGDYDKEKVVTDSFIIAERAGISHKSLRDNISFKWKKDLEDFGRLRFEKATLDTAGGMQEQSYYLLNEQQAMVLFTFMRNSDDVKEFKKNLIKAFYAMRDYIVSRKESRDIGIEIRKQLTSTIIDTGENTRMHNKGISNYTNLIYKSIFGLNSKQLYEQRGIPKDTKNLKGHLTEEELKQISAKESLVNGLLELNYQYDSIKNILKVK